MNDRDLQSPQSSAVIMIVDDDADLRGTLAEMLRFEGYEVLEAEDGAQALSMALERRPTLVLLDQRMPRMLGAEVFRRLRQAGIACPIVFMSAAGDLRSVAWSVGARYVLPKPFDADRLCSLVGCLVMDAGSC